MRKRIKATANRVVDGIASLGNLNHWAGWVAALERDIASHSDEQKSLADASYYVAWLLMSAEHLAYRLRWHFYADGEFAHGAVFDDGYSKLLRRAESVMPPGVHRDARFVVDVRHTLIHKGFPNLQDAPMKKGDATHLADVRNSILRPANFRLVKPRFESVNAWLDANSPPVEFGM